MKKIVIAGGSGFIGRLLRQSFLADGHQVVILGRSVAPSNDKNLKFLRWDAVTPGPWTDDLYDADVVINLAGHSINNRFTPTNKKLILESRVKSTELLAEVIRKSCEKPVIWLNSSGVAHYRSEGISDEYAPTDNQGFLADVCRRWEDSLFRSEMKNVRRVALRTSVVLGEGGGALEKLTLFTKLGLGGKQGRGDQYMSWIHSTDFTAAVKFIIDNTQLQGVINMASPNPVTNEALMQALRSALNVPFGLPAPEIAIQVSSLFLGVEPSLILDSSRVIPAVLCKNGFVFQYPHVSHGLSEIFRK